MQIEQRESKRIKHKAEQNKEIWDVKSRAYGIVKNKIEEITTTR